MTYFWVFHNNKLYYTFDRGFSASEVHNESFIYHVSGSWSYTANSHDVVQLEDHEVPAEVRALHLLIFRGV